MGFWNNTLYINDSDLEGISDALVALAEREGRELVTPRRRRRDDDDEMHYGQDDAWRMGVALFPGAPGWTVAKTAPLEWLLYRDRLGSLASALGVAAFQHNVYDGDSDILVEADASGHVCVTGFCSDDIERLHGEEPTPDRVEARFVLTNVAQDARRAGQGDIVSGLMPSPELPAELDDSLQMHLADLREWIAAVGGSVEESAPGLLRWNVIAAAIVQSMMSAQPAPVGPEERSRALALVFAGASAEWTDNLISVHHLVTHERLPMPGGRALYFDRP